MRALMALVALVTVTTAAAAYDPGCADTYKGYPGWAQEAFCRPSPGGD
jgi:hypothetical protein